MAIQFNPLLNSFGLSENILYHSLGKLKGYSIRVINLAHHFLQNEKIAVSTVITFNMIIPVIIFRKSVFKIISLSLTKTLPKTWATNDSIVIPIFYSLFLGIITSLNIGVYKILKPSLSPMAYTALSVTALLATSLIIIRKI